MYNAPHTISTFSAASCKKIQLLVKIKLTPPQVQMIQNSKKKECVALSMSAAV